jgi:ABC-type amino acid transport substrate-binding protein
VPLIKCLVVSFCLLIGAWSLAAEQADYFHQTEKAGKAEVKVLYVGSTGWAYRDDAGELTGVTVEIMRRFADWAQGEYDLALELAFIEESDWTVFYQRVRDASGGVFGLGNVTITEARREELAFSPAYVTNVAVLISHRDIGLVDEPSDLARGFGKLTALAFADTLHEARLRALAEQYWPTMPLAFSRSNDDILARVAEGTHFAYIDAYNYYRARQQGAPLHHHPAFDDPGEEFGIIMPLDNDWQPALAKFFHADGGLLNSPWYHELLSSHLGPEVAEILIGQAN